MGRLVPSPSRSHVFYSMSLHVDVHVLLAAKALVTYRTSTNYFRENK